MRKGSADRRSAEIENKIRFLGGGDEYVMGVPARDLTAEEWGRLPAAVREKCLATGLYAPDEAEADDDPFPEDEGEISCQ